MRTRQEVPIYQMKLTLRSVKPPIWRRVQMRGNSTLSTLHETIQLLMGWQDGHLHEFEADDVRYGVPEPRQSDFWGEPVKAESRARLQQVLPAEKCRLTYTYDFGDNWLVDVVLERILPPDDTKRYPLCLAGRRAGPPDDSGGPWGYMEMLQVLADPKHPDHEEMKEWLGGDWDAEAFTVDEANGLLSVLRQPRPRGRWVLSDLD